MTQQQARQRIADELRADPTRSDRAIGKLLGVDGKTVASVRRTLESTAEIARQDRTIGADGKARPRGDVRPAYVRCAQRQLDDGIAVYKTPRCRPDSRDFDGGTESTVFVGAVRRYLIFR